MTDPKAGPAMPKRYEEPTAPEGGPYVPPAEHKGPFRSKTQPRQRTTAGAPSPTSEPEELTEAEREAREVEKARIVEAGRSGAFFPLGKPEPGEEPERELIVLDGGGDATGKPADVRIDLLRDIGREPARKEREYLAGVRAELEPLAVEAEALHKAYVALAAEVSPIIGPYLSLDFRLIGRTVAAAGRYGGTAAVENLRHKLEDLAGSLSSHSRPENALARVPRQVRGLSLADIRGGLLPEIRQTVAYQRGGAAQLRANFQVVQRLMADLTVALDGLTPAVPPINTTKPWPVPFDPDKFIGATRGGDPRVSITEFNPLYDRSA